MPSLIEEAAHDAFILRVNADGRVVEDAAADLSGKRSLILVLLGLGEDLLSAREPFRLIWSQVVALEEPADAESDLSLGPSSTSKVVLPDLLEVASAALHNPFKELLVLLLGPVVTLLHVEVLEVERAILNDDVP